MLLAACVDAGADLATVEDVVRRIVGPAVSLHRTEVNRAGARATLVRVELDGENTPHRTWRSIRGELEAAAIPEATRAMALAAFAALAEAEGRVHGIDPGDIHFHEAGALDSIADVVGTCEALRQLGVTSVSASPVALGAGRIRAAHGDIPVPVPAVAQLALGWQVAGLPGAATEEVGELATPTGMALVRSLATHCEPLPALTLATVGIGAGTKDFSSHPNVVRLLIGTPPRETSEGLRELRANIDDMDPRLWPGVLDALLAAGAVDAWLVPIIMKKGRPAHCLHALAAAGRAEAVTDAMLEHTTTLGVRSTPVERTVLERVFADVSVAGYPVTVKVGHRDGVVVNVAAEFDSVRATAAELRASELDVITRTVAAAAAAGLVTGAALADATVELS